MKPFTDDKVKLGVLKERAFNYRWAEVENGVIPLTAADSDFAAPKEVTNAIIEYLKGGYLSYTPKMGFLALREALSRSFKAKNEEISPETILPVDSAARGMYIIAQSVLKKGDKAIVFDPVDYLFKSAVLAAGGVPVYYPAPIKDGRIDLSRLERYITPKTKMLCLCNPHNPYGLLYTKEELDYLLRICEKHGLWIMNDEVWSDIVYGEKPFVSLHEFGAERNRRTLSVYGFSKTYGIAGLRAGCVYCTDPEAFQKLVDTSAVMTTAGGISSLSQVGALACLEKAQDWKAQFLQHLKSNRDLAWERLQDIPMLSTHKPEATFVYWINIKETGLSSSAFCDYVRSTYKLALVPGSEQMFGPGAEGYVRLSYATSRALLKEGLGRLKMAIEWRWR